jgi:hypothetical protein
MSGKGDNGNRTTLERLAARAVPPLFLHGEEPGRFFRFVLGGPRKIGEARETGNIQRPP